MLNPKSCNDCGKMRICQKAKKYESISGALRELDFDIYVRVAQLLAEFCGKYIPA